MNKNTRWLFRKKKTAPRTSWEEQCELAVGWPGSNGSKNIRPPASLPANSGLWSWQRSVAPSTDLNLTGLKQLKQEQQFRTCFPCRKRLRLLVQHETSEASERLVFLGQYLSCNLGNKENPPSAPKIRVLKSKPVRVKPSQSPR